MTILTDSEARAAPCPLKFSKPDAEIDFATGRMINGQHNCIGADCRMGWRWATAARHAQHCPVVAADPTAPVITCDCNWTPGRGYCGAFGGPSQ